jgi:hypothetical protein
MPDRKNAKAPDYAVGYGRPPKASQFAAVPERAPWLADLEVNSSSSPADGTTINVTRSARRFSTKTFPGWRGYQMKTGIAPSRSKHSLATRRLRSEILLEWYDLAVAFLSMVLLENQFLEGSGDRSRCVRLHEKYFLAVEHNSSKEMSDIFIIVGQRDSHGAIR